MNVESYQVVIGLAGNCFQLEFESDGISFSWLKYSTFPVIDDLIISSFQKRKSGDIS